MAYLKKIECFIFFTIYSGLFFVSLKILPIYSPIIPIESNCMPPKKVIKTTSDVKPATGSWKKIVLITIVAPYKNPVTADKNPIIDASRNGMIEKEVRPSNAKLNKLSKFNLVLPDEIKKYSKSNN